MDIASGCHIIGQRFTAWIHSSYYEFHALMFVNETKRVIAASAFVWIRKIALQIGRVINKCWLPKKLSLQIQIVSKLMEKKYLIRVLWCIVHWWKEAKECCDDDWLIWKETPIFHTFFLFHDICLHIINPKRRVFRCISVSIESRVTYRYNIFFISH